MYRIAIHLSFLFAIVRCNSPVGTYQEIYSQKFKAGIFRRLEECVEKGGVTGIVNCAASRALKMLSKTMHEKTLQISPQIQLIAESQISPRTAKTLTTFRESDLPQDPSEQATVLLKTLIETVGGVISGRTLRIKLPELNSSQYGRALDEGRAKIKKIMGPFMMGVGSNMMAVIPILMGGLALLSAKALVVGKLALAVSVVMVLQYIISHRTSDVPPSVYPYSGFNSVNSGNYPATYGSNIPNWVNSQYPYARSLDVSEEKLDVSSTEQQLAYSRH